MPENGCTNVKPDTDAGYVAVTRLSVIEVGEYEGVVRISRRGVPNRLSGAPPARKLARCLPPSSNPARTHYRAEGSTAAVDRRWEYRDHWSRLAGASSPTNSTPGWSSPGSFMRAGVNGGYGGHRAVGAI